MENVPEPDVITVGFVVGIVPIVKFPFKFTIKLESLSPKINKHSPSLEKLIRKSFRKSFRKFFRHELCLKEFQGSSPRSRLPGA